MAPVLCLQEAGERWKETSVFTSCFPCQKEHGRGLTDALESPVLVLPRVWILTVGL